MFIWRGLKKGFDVVMESISIFKLMVMYCEGILNDEEFIIDI